MVAVSIRPVVMALSVQSICGDARIYHYIGFEWQIHGCKRGDMDIISRNEFEEHSRHCCSLIFFTSSTLQRYAPHQAPSSTLNSPWPHPAPSWRPVRRRSGPSSAPSTGGLSTPPGRPPTSKRRRRRRSAFGRSTCMYCAGNDYFGVQKKRGPRDKAKVIPLRTDPRRQRCSGTDGRCPTPEASGSVAGGRRSTITTWWGKRETERAAGCIPTFWCVVSTS